MTGTLKIGNTRFVFTFRNKWDGREESSYNHMFKDWRVGGWFRRGRCLVPGKRSHPRNWKNNLVNEYTVGLDLLVCRMWMSFNKIK